MEFLRSRTQKINKFYFPPTVKVCYFSYFFFVPNQHIVQQLELSLRKRERKMPKVTFQIEKEPPKASGDEQAGDNVELFHGIGNTLGLDITGGSDFSMPITIFHVSF